MSTRQIHDLRRSLTASRANNPSLASYPSALSASRELSRHRPRPGAAATREQHREGGKEAAPANQLVGNQQLLDHDLARGEERLVARGALLRATPPSDAEGVYAN